MSAFDLARVQLALQEQLHEARLKVDPTARDGITQALENAFIGFVQRLAPPLVLEIGAHEAGFSRRCKAALPKTRVVAFEANPAVFQRFAEAARAAGVDYVNMAAARVPGQLTFSVPIAKDSPREVQRMGSLMPGRAKSEHRSYQVDAVRLDDWLGEEAGRPSVIWIDVEGAIEMVLDGALRTLDSCLAVYAEVEATESWAGQMLDTGVMRRLLGHGLVPVLRDVQRRGWQYNCLFIRETLLAQAATARLVSSFAGGLFNAPAAPAAGAAGAMGGG